MTKIEAIDWLKNLMTEIDSADSKGTAKPFQYLLQQKREYVSHPGYGIQTRKIYYHHIMEDGGAASYEEAVSEITEYYGKDHEEIETEIGSIEEFEMGHYWETSQAFLTENGLKRHLDINGHNLGERRGYVVHAFRNPEMVELFEAIRAIVK